jgi:hypothetical protein
MDKTPKELAEEWIETNGWNTEPFRDEHTIEFQKQGYVSGYLAAKDEILSKGMQGYITEIRNDAWCTAMQLGQQSQWISVKDRLPEIGEWVLINGPEVCQRIEPPSSKWDCEFAWATDHGSFYKPTDITHWQPLPAAPEGEK